MRKYASLLLIGLAVFFSATVCQAQETEPGVREVIENNIRLGIQAPDFPKYADWFNSGGPLSLKDLKGKVVLLDFWTYASINCMHVLPDLKKLEKKYPEELVVIGVHSGKFKNERESENIRQSILRYGIEHPVVNDYQLITWQNYDIEAWPTFILIAPDGNIVLSVSGEGNYGILDRAVQSLITIYKADGQLNQERLNFQREKATETFLLFPGKLWVKNGQIVVSDSNHHRVLLSDAEGIVSEQIGEGEPGFRDGPFGEARFNRPQGVVRDEEIIYVADTGNHSVRRVDLREKRVTTVAGTGAQGGTLLKKGPALRTALNSPWDLVLKGDFLYIAMAGAHQIWALDLKDGTLGPFAGSGRANITDGPFGQSELAQPSGITRDTAGNFYIADSAVSAVRKLDSRRKSVETLVGRGLFDFGDKDGSFDGASLQHPMGIYHHEGKLYVADTYNHKIKVLDLASRRVKTLLGDAASPDARHFYEPSGLAMDGGKLYIADTNNHAIRVYDFKAKTLRTLVLREENASVVGFAEAIEFPLMRVAPGSTRLHVMIQLPDGHEFTKGDLLQFDFKETSSAVRISPVEGTLEDPSPRNPFKISIESLGENEAQIKGWIKIPYCTMDEPKLCKLKEYRITLPLVFETPGKSQASVVLKVIEEEKQEIPGILGR